MTSSAERSMGIGVWTMGFGLLESVSGRKVSRLQIQGRGIRRRRTEPIRDRGRSDRALSAAAGQGPPDCGVSREVASYPERLHHIPRLCNISANDASYPKELHHIDGSCHISRKDAIYY